MRLLLLEILAIATGKQDRPAPWSDREKLDMIANVAKKALKCVK